MRIVSKNLIPSGQISGDGLALDNLKNTNRYKLWRAENNQARLVVRFDAPQNINFWALAYTNFSDAARVQIRAKHGDLVKYEIARAACLMPPLGFLRFGSPLVNAYPVKRGAAYFARGGFSHALFWLPRDLFADVLEIEIIDAENNELEAALMFAGEYLEPHFKHGQGARLEYNNNDQIERSTGGALIVQEGYKTKRLIIPLDVIADYDRAAVAHALASPAFFFSAYPLAVDVTLEQDFSIFGRLAKPLNMARVQNRYFSASCEIEEF